MFDVTERVRIYLYLLESYVFSTTLRVFACNECCLFLSSEMDEKLTELVRKCEELCDISNKKFSDSVWKEKLWGRVSEELKKYRKFQCFLLHILKLLSFCYHRSSNNKQRKMHSVGVVEYDW
jgi:hypothetical protein